MAEGIGWAGINEVPVVVTLYQRGGPSTGLPTRHEQGDLGFALHIGHGEFPRIVLASGDLEEAFYDTAKAFNYAEKYSGTGHPHSRQGDGELRPDLPMFDPKPGKDREGRAHQRWHRGQRGRGIPQVQADGVGDLPGPAIGTKGGIYWNTGDEHDEKGHISEDPTNRDDDDGEEDGEARHRCPERDSSGGEGPLLRPGTRRSHW